MTNSIKQDLEQFYEYEKFDLDSLDQVKFRKAIVKEINQACPLTTIQDNFDEWILYNAPTSRASEECERITLDANQLGVMYGSKLIENYERHNEILPQTDRSKANKNKADVSFGMEEIFRQRLRGEDASAFSN